MPIFEEKRNQCFFSIPSQLNFILSRIIHRTRRSWWFHNAVATSRIVATTTTTTTENSFNTFTRWKFPPITVQIHAHIVHFGTNSTRFYLSNSVDLCRAAALLCNQRRSVRHITSMWQRFYVWSLANSWDTAIEVGLRYTPIEVRSQYTPIYTGLLQSSRHTQQMTKFIADSFHFICAVLSNAIVSFYIQSWRIFKISFFSSIQITPLFFFLCGNFFFLWSLKDSIWENVENLALVWFWYCGFDSFGK